MKRKNRSYQKKGSNSLNKLSLFQKNDGRYSKECPFSVKKCFMDDTFPLGMYGKPNTPGGESGKNVVFRKIVVSSFTTTFTHSNCHLNENFLRFTDSCLGCPHRSARTHFLHRFDGKGFAGFCGLVSLPIWHSPACQDFCRHGQ